MSEIENRFMKAAIREAAEGIRNREGGPFGSVVVSSDAIVGFGHNRVVSSNDPSAHAEIVAIRAAGRALGRFDLSDCSIYSTCEPCPMCRSAIHWARIHEVVYGCSRYDASTIGFDDELLYRILADEEVPARFSSRVAFCDECLEIFREYESMADKTSYTLRLK